MQTNYLSFFFGHLAELISVLMALAILTDRREARATLGWLLLVIFLPYVGVILYILFGRRRAEYPVRRAHPALSQKKSDTPLPPHMALTEKITGLPAVGCRDLYLLSNAREKYDRLFADIRGAKKRVVLCYYVFRRDKTGLALLDLLAQKAEEGVAVYLLFDGWGAFGLGLFGRLSPYRKKGVKAVPFARVISPLKMSRINFRNHRKIVVIDGETAYTGSTNIGDEYLGESPRFGPWRDFHVRLAGEAAAVLEEVFVGDWAIATGKTLNFDSSETQHYDQTPIHVLPTGPDIQEDLLYPLLFAHIGRATRSIEIITPYLVPNQGLIAALSVAARQGVRVRILLPKYSNHPMVAAAGRSHYQDLLEGGVEVLETPNAMLHAKAFLVDGEWAMLGSANFDNRSFFLNFEINVAIEDPDFVGAVSEKFEQWAAEAEGVSLISLANRPLLLRLYDSFCRTLSPVL
jgi:cardiolipin synthase